MKHRHVQLGVSRISNPCFIRIRLWLAFVWSRLRPPSVFPGPTSLLAALVCVFLIHQIPVQADTLDVTVEFVGDSALSKTATGRWVGGSHDTVILQPATTCERTLRCTFAGAVREVRPKFVVQLVNGDRLMARECEGQDDQLQVELLEGPAIKFPISYVQSIVGPAARAEEAGQLWRTVADQDQLHLDHNETFSGDFREADRTTVKFQLASPKVVRENRDRLFAWNRVQGLVMAQSLLGQPPTSTNESLWTLRFGTMLAVAKWERTPAGTFSLWPSVCVSPEKDAAVTTSVSLGEDQVHAVNFFNQQRTLLSFLKPKVISKPGLVDALPWQLNRNVRGGPLVVRGTPYARGFGVWGGDVLEVSLDRRFSRLRTLAGVDDSATGATPPNEVVADECVFSIELDNREVYRSPPQSMTSPLLAIPPIDLQGANRLRLTVSPNGPDNRGTCGDWILPVLEGAN